MKRAEADQIEPPCRPVAVTDVRHMRHQRVNRRGVDPVAKDFLERNSLPGSTYRVELLNLDGLCVRVFAYDLDDAGCARWAGYPAGESGLGDDIEVVPPKIYPLRTEWPDEWAAK